MTDKVSETFCILPWVHLHSWPNGTTKLCCLSDNAGDVGDLTKNTITEIQNNETMKKIRKSLLKGERVSFCKSCYKLEDAGINSWRADFNRSFDHLIENRINNTLEDGALKDPKLFYMDFRFSNLCNLECRTCGPDLSSSIAANIKERKFHPDQIEDYKEKGIISKSENIIAYSGAPKYNNYFNEEIKDQLHNVEQFYFAGGEPLLQPEHAQILKYLVDNKLFNKTLIYSTNATSFVYKKHDFFEDWKKFKAVNVIHSIDGHHKVLEYIRQNGIHDKIYGNLEKCIEQPNIGAEICHVISIYNAWEFFDFLEYIDHYIPKLHSFHLNFAFGEHNAIGILPNFAKKELFKKFEEQFETNESCKKFLMWNKEHTEKIANFKEMVENQYPHDEHNKIWEEFVDRTKRWDKLYNKNIGEHIPWLTDVIKRYESGQR